MKNIGGTTAIKAALTTTRGYRYGRSDPLSVAGVFDFLSFFHQMNEPRERIILRPDGSLHQQAITIDGSGKKTPAPRRFIHRKASPVMALINKAE
ncbi:MAG: hypothetical protein U0401_33605 [Anaerolineae bacterium]